MKEGITDEYGFTEQVVTETRERIIGYKSVMRESERLTENWEAKLEEKSKKLESELDGG
jgi:type VI secretion system secreted protein VgrG